MTKYRLYIDEVGNPHLESSSNPQERYLSLSGVVVALDYVQHTLFPQMESLKQRYFGSHPDEPIIFHRKELMNRKYPFQVLRDESLAQKFDHELLEYLRQWEYTLITVTIDKQEHLQRYQIWRYDTYHYCLKILVERYTQWLLASYSVGDVMAESRGAKEDERLKRSFARVFEEGTEYILPEKIQACITSSQLKVKPKSNNISGLQLADLVAHPSFKAALARHNKETLTDNFGGKVAKILEELKYYMSPSGKIDGWGRKWLP